jgi:hypothetical protein
MADPVRIIAIGGTIGVLVAGVIVAPQVLAAVTEVPAKIVGDTSLTDIFPAPFDPSKLRKFDFTFDETISKQITSTTTVRKIGFGRTTSVTIVTTPSGTYSSDAIASPYVRYPGITVTPRHWHHDDDWAETAGAPTQSGEGWTAVSHGSFVWVIRKADAESQT